MLVENRQCEPTPLLFGAPVDAILISPRFSATENSIPQAIVWRYLRDPMFSRFGTVPVCDSRTDRRTDCRTDTGWQHIPR